MGLELKGEDNYKARPVAKDYETLEYNDSNIEQTDVKTAFLDGILQKEICINLPEDMKNEDVCRLNKSLYGLT